jgi:hypothetical protein
MTIRYQFPNQAARNRYVSEVNGRHLAARVAHEMAHMSPHIRPEHYAACVTQTVVAAHGALDCDAADLVTWATGERTPGNAQRVRVTLDEEGNETGRVDENEDER